MLPRMSRVATLLVISVVALAPPALAAGAASRYKGSVGGDKSQTLTFQVKGGKVRNWTATIYATCYTGGLLITVVVPKAALRGGRFSAKYKPTSGPTEITLKGRIVGGRATGTIAEMGSCGFNTEKWNAKSA